MNISTWKSMSLWQKALNIVVLLVILSILIALVQVVTEKVADAQGCSKHANTQKTRWLGDKRHAGFTLARLDTKANACIGRKGQLKGAHARNYVDSNSVAAMLGYRYGFSPGSSTSYRNGGLWKQWAMDAYYRQCIPGPLGNIACGPTGTYTIWLTYWSPKGKRVARHSGIKVSCTWCYHTSKNSQFAKTFMIINDNSW